MWFEYCTRADRWSDRVRGLASRPGMSALFAESKAAAQHLNQNPDFAETKSA